MWFRYNFEATTYMYIYNAYFENVCGLVYLYDDV
jgi:hypothetical protein